MANYKNTRGRSYAQRRRSSSGGILKTVGTVLVVFLAISLIGSLFSRPSSTTKQDVKDPTVPEESVPEESIPEADENNPTEPVELITFSIGGLTCNCEAGMSWADFVDSDYNKNGLCLGTNDDYLYSGNGDFLSYDYSGTKVISTD